MVFGFRSGSSAALLLVIASLLASCGGTSEHSAPRGVPNNPAGSTGSPGGTGGGGHGATSGSGNAGTTHGGAAGRAGDANLGGVGASVGGASQGGGSGTPPGGGAGANGTGGSSGRNGASGTSGGSASGTNGGGASGRSEGGAGGHATGGLSDGGGSSGRATGGTTSTVGGAGPMPGFSCYGTAHCDPGERCIDCNQGEITNGLCAPSPTSDPDGYKSATAACLTVGSKYGDCDGPEDCAVGQYCVVNGAPSTGSCQTDPAPDPATCCFTCDSLPVCTLCWADEDCPSGYLCTPNGASPHNVGGCRVAD